MILQDINIQTLAELFEPHMNKPAWPGLTDPKVKENARDYAKKTGLWEKIGAKIDPNREIPVIKRSVYRDYLRTGSREKANRATDARVTATSDAALALWLDHPAANLDYLQDLIWAWCETSWLKLVAEEGRHIDLLSSLRCRQLAEYSFVFADQLESEVREKISQMITAQILDIALDYRRPDWWETADNNWNTVCNANIISTALYEVKAPLQLAALIHPICRRMDYALAYYTNDGGCVEGPGYWEYGFGHFVEAAVVMQHRTGGAVNLMKDEKIERICRFPLAAYLRSPLRATFADAGNGWLNALVALEINHFMALPELYQLVKNTDHGFLELNDMRSLALFQNEKAIPHTDRTDYFLPDLGYAKVHAAEADVTLAAIAGRNDVSHNHNDIGSFVLVKKGIALLTDPGAPVYTARTFSERRYEHLVCRSKGHSIPVINGCEQCEGSAFFGTINVDGLNSSAAKAIVLDLSHAYPDPSLRKFIRQIILDKSGSIRLIDSFEFDSPVTSLQEAFITFEPAEVLEDKVTVGTGDSAVVITANAPGNMFIECFSPSEHEGVVNRPLYRICFVPQILSQAMSLEFAVI